MANQRLPETAFRFVFCVYKNEGAADEIGFLCVSYGQDDVGISHRQLWQKMLGMYVEHYEANRREPVTAERNASWITRAAEILSKNVCAGYFNPTDQGPLGEIVDGLSSSLHNIEERESLIRLEQLIKTGREGGVNSNMDFFLLEKQRIPYALTNRQPCFACVNMRTGTWSTNKLP